MESAIKKYSQIIDKTKQDGSNNSTQVLDADVIVAGAGIAGASIAYQCGLDPNCKVIVLDRFDFSTSSDDNKDEKCINHGSSRGNSRRIGTVGGDERTLRAWKSWLELQSSITNKKKQQGNNDEDEEDILDVSGEVYVFKLFPIGILFVTVLVLFMTYHRVKGTNDKIPDGFQILYTSSMIENKLGPKQGFRSQSWNGCIGIYHKEAAVLHTCTILKYFLHHHGDKGENENTQNNKEVRYGSKVTNIEMKKTKSGAESMVTVTVVSSTNASNGANYKLNCRHLALAAGGWTGELLKVFLKNHQQQTTAPYSIDIHQIQDNVEVFTCPVYNIVKNENIDSNTTITLSPRPPLSLAAGCPIFSCVHRKVYGFPINHERQQQPWQLAIRPFYKASESDDPDDQQTSQSQKDEVNTFVQEYILGSTTTPDIDDNDAKINGDYDISYSHCYTCRYPKLSFDGGKSFKQVFDFVPDSNQQIVVVAGLDGYGFKFGSIYGKEFLELIDTKKPPQETLVWPPPDDEKKAQSNIILRILQSIFLKLIQKQEKEGGVSNEEASKKED